MLCTMQENKGARPLYAVPASARLHGQYLLRVTVTGTSIVVYGEFVRRRFVNRMKPPLVSNGPEHGDETPYER